MDDPPPTLSSLLSAAQKPIPPPTTPATSADARTRRSARRAACATAGGRTRAARPIRHRLRNEAGSAGAGAAAIRRWGPSPWVPSSRGGTPVRLRATAWWARSRDRAHRTGRAHRAAPADRGHPRDSRSPLARVLPLVGELPRSGRGRALGSGNRHGRYGRGGRDRCALVLGAHSLLLLRFRIILRQEFRCFPPRSGVGTPLRHGHVSRTSLPSAFPTARQATVSRTCVSPRHPLLLDKRDASAARPGRGTAARLPRLGDTMAG